MSEPMVSDYAAAVKPPWVVLAIVVCLLALVMPREVLPEFGTASAVVAAAGMVVNPFRTTL